MEVSSGKTGELDTYAQNTGKLRPPPPLGTSCCCLFSRFIWSKIITANCGHCASTDKEVLPHALPNAREGGKIEPRGLKFNNVWPVFVRTTCARCHLTIQRFAEHIHTLRLREGWGSLNSGRPVARGFVAEHSATCSVQHRAFRPWYRAFWIIHHVIVSRGRFGIEFIVIFIILRAVLCVREKEYWVAWTIAYQFLEQSERDCWQVM